MYHVYADLDAAANLGMMGLGASAFNSWMRREKIHPESLGKVAGAAGTVYPRLGKVGGATFDTAGIAKAPWHVRAIASVLPSKVEHTPGVKTLVGLRKHGGHLELARVLGKASLKDQPYSKIPLPKWKMLQKRGWTHVEATSPLVQIPAAVIGHKIIEEAPLPEGAKRTAHVALAATPSVMAARALVPEVRGVSRGAKILQAAGLTRKGYVPRAAAHLVPKVAEALATGAVGIGLAAPYLRNRS